ncbi:phage antirepressor KilAC domain-containing protein [Enterobacter ludwigii]|uniref:phage antirepressor KilAC domain-containing protein n=1 Tax=Enterobacter ludwigii TaxID=299767 RepID=UPI002A841847|nr:phage antirepressor KilAC domain-containing protein [Enterobacter ludwigii]
MKLVLPFPPSVNTYWRAPNKGPLKGRHLISEKGRAYQSAACAAIIEQLRCLPKDLCLTLVSGYNVVLRKRIIDRWLELEQQNQPKVPQSFSEALRLAAELEEQKQMLTDQLAIAAPKAEFVDRYVVATGSMTFRQVAKLLNAKEPEFRLFLLDNHIMYRLNGTLTPYHQHIEAERFEVKTGTTNASNYAFSQARFTAKGVKWIGGLWAEHIAKGQIA